MKTILLENTESESARAVCLPDSALVLQGRPLFIPHYAEEFSVFFCPVVKITRVGKTIGERFAGRYYSEIAPMIRLAAADDPYPQSALISCGDSMAYLGNFSAMPEDPDAGIRFTLGGSLMEQPGEMTVGAVRRLMDRAISLVSRKMTLKNGDLVSPVSIRLTGARTPVPDTDITATAPDGTGSRFRFK